MNRSRPVSRCAGCSKAATVSRRSSATRRSPPAERSTPVRPSPLERLRDRILTGRHADAEPSEDETATAANATVTASLLNVRSQPSGSTPLAGDPIEKGSRVEVVERNGVWQKVRICHEGWVHSDYLQTDTPVG
ncbi:MAG: SH3 domain-containing protein [Campylobacterales bacterium]|nr:SH3 domain-containing protein [Campylobacterales bacterium]